MTEIESEPSARAIDHARRGDLEAMAVLLAQGLSVDLCNENGDSLLMLAGYHGHAALVTLLLQPLGAAAFKGDPRVVTAMLDGGAAIDGHGPDGRTALMLAAMFDRTSIVDLLLARGADAHRRDAEGRSAEDLAHAMKARGTIRRLPRAARS